jgi:hypothetical protein
VPKSGKTVPTGVVDGRFSSAIIAGGISSL